MGSCCRVEQGAAARVPLPGSRIEKFAVSQALEDCEADMDYLAARLPWTHFFRSKAPERAPAMPFYPGCLP